MIWREGDEITDEGHRKKDEQEESESMPIEDDQACIEAAWGVS